MPINFPKSWYDDVCDIHKVTSCPLCNKEEWFNLEEVWEQKGRTFPFTVDWKSINGIQTHEIISYDARLTLWCLKDGRYFTKMTGLTDEFRLAMPPTYVPVFIWTSECTEKSCPDLLRNGHSTQCKYFKGVVDG